MIHHRPLELTSPDGELIRADLRLPANGEPDTAIVVVHGFKGFKDWGFFPYLAESLASAGRAVLSFNFSFNGVGDDLENFSDLDAFARNSFTRELEETLWVIGQVANGSLLGSTPRRIGLLGHSRGGGGAILAARESRLVDALVTWAAVATFERWTPEQVIEWRRSGRIFIPNARTGQDMPLDVCLLEDLERNRSRLDILQAASDIDAPWLIVHGSNDPTVAVSDAQQLGSASPRARVAVLDGAGHTFGASHPFSSPSDELEDAIRLTLDFFDQALQI